MSKSRNLACTVAAIVLTAVASSGVKAQTVKTSEAVAGAKRLDIGRVATVQEIAGWDIDVRPDGEGAPPGHGSVKAPAAGRSLPAAPARSAAAIRSRR